MLKSLAIPDESAASALEESVRFARLIVSDDGSEVELCSAARTKCDWLGVLSRAGTQFGVFHRICSRRHTTFNFVVLILTAASRPGSVTKPRRLAAAATPLICNGIALPRCL
jgi:hypothetical protein